MFMSTKSVCMLLLSGVLFLPCSQVLSGKVIDKQGAGIDGALVELLNANLSATTANDGSFSISVPMSTKPGVIRRVYQAPQLIGSTLHFAVSDNSAHVTVSVYTLNGKFIYNALDRKLGAGFYSLNPISRSLKANIYAAKLQIGNESTFFKLPWMKEMNLSDLLRKGNKAATVRILQKRMVAVDSVRVSKTGYTAVSIPIGTYDTTMTITLEPYTPSYHINPPDPCYSRFYVDGCIEGDLNSACGGRCRVANSCSPPEDPSKANLPKTFICPRFMLFSTEMLQAAKDDAALYGWDADDPPFNYGVVGHDPDIGGVDDGPSSCCQCYQIIFEEPEPSSPKPPELPYPKPLIVQSFNTAASGPYGFDVFMGAGGYGAFNSCYDDPDFGNTSNFDEFIYDKYPYQNPGSGGISFLRYEAECRGNAWPPTIEALQSTACQEKIEEMCNQALVSSNPQVTEDTRRSCIESNKPGSLYHQNWKVMVKRVRCPDNLTRVTGCRLIENHLPLPFPEVQTPADATANGTFRSGYHTTTMQDCCKPTCAWTNWVADQNLPVDGEWNAFYSCDKNGIPFTK